MKEELIVSGRMNAGIDPVLEVWHWPIPLYLFLGGLAAGILFFAAYFTITGKENEYKTCVKIAPIIAPIIIILGLMALIYDLKHKLYFWQLLTTIRLESPMSWGAWTLTLIAPLSMLWVFSFAKDIMPDLKMSNRFVFKFLNPFITCEQNKQGCTWTWKMIWIQKFEKTVIQNRISLAWIILVLAVILGVYTGILLSAFNARPLWNTSILGPLFLVSGLSTAAATIMLLTENKAERKLFGRIDLMLIVIELFLITHLFMGFLAGSQVQINSAQLFLGGEFTVPFWAFVVILGLIVPALLEILELRGLHVPIAVPAILILIGGIMFRFIIVEAGQVTRFLY